MNKKVLYEKIKLYFKYLRRGVYASFLLVLIVFAWTMWQIEQAAGITSNENADAAIILGAAAWGKKPSPVFKERIRHGVNLYKENRVKMLIFTGGSPREGYQTEAQVGKDFAIEQGVPEQDIFIEDKSRTTYDNFAFSKKEVHGLSVESFLVVSDPYHMYRAMMIASDVGLNAYPSPTPSSKFNEPKGQIKFLLNETISSLIYEVRRLFL